MPSPIKSLLSFFSRAARKRGWRVGHQGRDALSYDELIEGQWERILIDGEMQCSDGNPQHIVWFPSADEWNELPAWAAGRREQILSRVQVELQPPKYEYEDAQQEAGLKSIEFASIWAAGLAAMTRSALWLVFAASVALVRAEAPSLAWTVPSPVAVGERMQDIRSQWIDEDVCIVLRRGGVLGRYHPKEMNVAWERIFEGSLEGECANRESVWMVQDIPGKHRGMIRISSSDGTITEKLRSIESRFGVKNSLLSGLEWLPGAKLLAIETLSDGRSDLYMVDPARTRASVMVPLKGYFLDSQVLDQAVTYVHHGVIYRVDAKKGEHHKVWDSGLGEGGDDFPAMRDFAVTADGGFIAIIDKGGWTRGFTVHQRKGQEGEIQSATTDLDAGLLKIDLPRRRILHVSNDKPVMQWLNFEAKLMGEPSKPLKNNFWHVSISPDGHRAALVDSESNLLFFTLP